MTPTTDRSRLSRFITGRVAQRGQGGFIILAGLAMWTLVGGMMMAALLGMTLSSQAIAAIGSERSQQARALDSALELAVVALQVDSSATVGVPTGKNGECKAGPGKDRKAGQSLLYDDTLGNVVEVSMRCFGETNPADPHIVRLTATLGPDAPTRMFARAELEVVRLPIGRNDVIVLSWQLASPKQEPGDPTVPTTSTTSTTTTPTTTTTTPTTTTTKPTTTTTPASPVTWSTAVSSDWGTGQCINVTIRNSGSVAADWRVTIPVKGTIYTLWNANWSMSGSNIVATGVDWNKTVQPGGTAEFGWCANY